MKNFYQFIFIGLLCLSSFHAFAADAGETDDRAPVKKTPTVDPTQIFDTAKKSDEPPPGETGYDPGDIVNPMNGAILTIKHNFSELIQGPVLETSNKIDKNTTSYLENQKTCKERADRANTWCIEGRNPDIAKYLTYASVAAAGVNGMMDSCSKIGDLMDLTNKVFTAYQAQCGAWKGFCSSSCGSAVKAVQDIKKNSDLFAKQVREAANAKIKADPNSASKYAELFKDLKEVELHKKALDKELEKKSNHMAVAQKLETCDSYTKEIAIAALGVASALKSFNQAKKCEDDTKDTAAIATPTPVDCTIPANKQNNMTCICQDAPRTAGCAGNLDSTIAAKSADALRAANGSEYTPSAGSENTSMNIGGGDEGPKLGANTGDGGGSLPGAPSGGGSANLGSGGFGSGGPGGGGQQAAGGLDTNILSGEGGGSGGGGWGSGGGGNGSNKALRQYLPGGLRDPAAALAGAATAKQVTSQGGKSNWEKVRDRYRDNKPSLLGY